jgi:DNA polymerase/3'-5' exonuclease PolX
MPEFGPTVTEGKRAESTMNYDLALKYANEIIELLTPFCERIEIAGGVRRHKENPHDIEIVCIPRSSKRAVQVGLVGDQKFIDENKLDQCIKDGLASDIFELGDPDKAGKRAPLGPRYYRLKYNDHKVDVFAVLPPAQWGVIFLIRTGNSDFSHWFVQAGWKDGKRVVDGQIIQNGKAFYTPEEKDAFEVMGLPWVDPIERNIEKTKELLQLHQ